MTHSIKDILETLSSKRDLSRQQAKWMFERIMAGEVPPPVIGAMLGAMWVKGESVSELVGAAEAMRASSIKIRGSADCIDTCGTGGDGISTFNVSTTAAIIAAAAGAVVAKHGNRSTSRASGSTEVLTHLGIDVEADVDLVEKSLESVGIAYLNARQLHPAMKHAAPVREALSVRTIFNLLGPLTNPAGAKRQLLGVPRPELMQKMAQALLELGAVHAWVVHGDGLCDLTITGISRVVELHHGQLREFEIDPQSLGLPRATRESLLVDSPMASAKIIRSILEGELGPPRDQALLNAGAALVIAGVADDLADGIARACESIDSGAAKDCLARWQSVTGKASN